MSLRRALLFCIAVVVAAVEVAAAPLELQRDCYAVTKIETGPITRDADIFVVLDETTVLDDHLKQQAVDQVSGLLVDNRGFTIWRFSAFIQGRYADLSLRGQISKDLTEEQRYDIPRDRIRRFDTCRSAEIADAKFTVGKTMLEIMNSASNDIARSDIITSLQWVSRAVAESKARRKLVFIISDMLENSSIASFYERGGLGVVNEKVFKDVEKAGLFGDFAGAAVYVLGAAVMPPAKDQKALTSYRDPRRIEALERFWAYWFERSHAKLVAFGKPTISVQIK
jgi:hypothetical protein